MQDGELPARHHADEQILADGGIRRGLAQVRRIEPEGDRKFVPEVGDLAVLHRRAVVLARLCAKRDREQRRVPEVQPKRSADGGRAGESVHFLRGRTSGPPRVRTLRA